MQCSIRFKIPIPVESFRRLTGDTPELEQVLGEEFNVSYKYDQGPSICDGCMASKGICGTNLTDPNREFLCLCRDQPYSVVCKGQLSMPFPSFFLPCLLYVLLFISVCFVLFVWVINLVGYLGLIIRKRV
ncbi:hypothetical protein NC651_036858 [Populus alba x Populus x berolinensis]|nr:hypothetical protein NC651_036858 [Populus alba x Populus x berolinensis]